MKSAAFSLPALGSLLVGWILTIVVPGSSLYAWMLIAAGVVLLAIAAILDFTRLRGALASDSGRFRVGSTLATSLFLGIVLLVNAISVNQNRRFDFTGLQQFTLTSQTKDVLEEISGEVEIVQLFSSQVPPTVSGYSRDLLAEYQIHSDKLTVRNIDPEVQPDQARRYGLDRAGALLGSVIFIGEYGRKQVLGPRIAAGAEYAFTTAILEVSGSRQKKVYFTVGHGEHGIQVEYASARNGLRENLFDVSQIDLSSPIPEDAAVVIMAGPKLALLRSESELINSYVEQGGRFFLLLDPNPSDSYRDLVSEWGMNVAEGFVMDPVSHVAPYRDNPFVPSERNAMQLEDVYFAGATAILPQDPRPESIALTALVWTSREAWLEKAALDASEATFDAETEQAGSVAIGVLREVGESRVVIIGDSDFAANANFQNGGNSALFLSAVNWLTENEAIISIDRRILATRRLLLNPEQARFLQISSIGLLPLLLLVGAVAVWWRRRQS
jgi:ABC-type uncharacterized transport system involved in gliding motility auxiliary subunit